MTCRRLALIALFLSPLSLQAGGDFDSLYVTRFVMNCASHHENGLNYQSVATCACALDVFRHRGYTRRALDFALAKGGDRVDRETFAIIERRCVAKR